MEKEVQKKTKHFLLSECNPFQRMFYSKQGLQRKQLVQYTWQNGSLTN